MIYESLIYELLHDVIFVTRVDIFQLFLVTRIHYHRFHDYKYRYYNFFGCYQLEKVRKFHDYISSVLGISQSKMLWLISIVLREGYTVKFFFQSISWNRVAGSFHETWNTFMKYFYFSIQHSFCMFLINEKIVFAEKRYPANIYLLTYFTTFSSVSVADFKQVNVSWVSYKI